MRGENSESIKNDTCAGMWKSLLQAVCGAWDGRDGRRKEVYRVLGEKIQPEVKDKYFPL